MPEPDVVRRVRSPRLFSAGPVGRGALCFCSASSGRASSRLSFGHSLMHSRATLLSSPHARGPSMFSRWTFVGKLRAPSTDEPMKNPLLSGAHAQTALADAARHCASMADVFVNVKVSASAGDENTP